MSDSCLDGAASVFTREIDGKVITNALAYINQPGQYILRIEAVNYNTKDIIVDIPKIYKREKYRELPITYMHRKQQKNEIELDEILVKATKLKFYFNGDTIVYNADAFSLAEGSMLNVLLKKLPGVEFNQNGEIFYNGRRVESLLLNGKNFFDNNREFLFENMPAYYIRNIQFYERVPDLQKGTNMEKIADKELVMNVIMKRDYNNGYITSLELGKGTSYEKDDEGKYNDKKLGRGLFMGLSDRYKIACFLNTNNLNDMNTPGEGGDWSDFSLSNGVTDMYLTGINYNIQKNDNNRLFGNTNVSYNERIESNRSYEEMFLTNNVYSNLFSKSKKYDFVIMTNNNLTFSDQNGLWYKNIHLNLKPYFAFSHNNNNQNVVGSKGDVNLSTIYGEALYDSISTPNLSNEIKKMIVNRAISKNRNNRDWYDLHIPGSFVWTPLHNSFYDVKVDYDYQYIYSSSANFEHYNLIKTNEDALDVFQNRYSPEYYQSNKIYTNPRLFFFIDSRNKHALGLHNAITYNYEKSNQPIYMLNLLSGWNNNIPIGDLPSNEQLLEILDNNSVFSRTILFSYKPNLTYQFYSQHVDYVRYWIISTGLDLRNEKIGYKQGTLYEIEKARNLALLNMSVSYCYKNGEKGRYFNIDSRFISAAPSLLNLLDVVNSKDVLQISHGNNKLENAHYYLFSTSYRDRYKRTFYNSTIKLNMSKHAIATSIVYNQIEGVKHMTPMNIDGNWNADITCDVDFPLLKSDELRIKNDISYGFYHSVDLLGTSNSYDLNSVTKSTVCSNILTNGCTINYQPNDKIDLSLKCNINYHNSVSKRIDFIPINAINFNYGLTTQVELPWMIKFSSNLTMYSRRGYSDITMNTNELIWDAHISKSLFDGNLVMQFDGFDILRNKSNVIRTINAQGITETFSYVIPSYCLFHVIWRFNGKINKKGI